MDDSTLGRLVDSYNTDLDKLTTTQSQALLDAWTAGQRDVTEQLARLQDRIQQATDAGETVSPSWLLQRDRLTDVNDAVARQITAVSNVLGRTVPAAIQQAATLGDTHAAALISELDPYGIAAQLGGVNTPAVTNLTATVSAGGPLDKVLAGFADPGPMQDRIRSELTAGIITGRNPRETARRIRQVSATGTLARAETIARTETLRAYRNAQQQAYDTSPVVDGWTWLSAQNARTCTACWVMTGSVHPTTEKLAGHVNCRCRMIPRTPSWESLGFTGLPDTNPQVPAGPDTLGAMSADELVHIIGADKYRRYKAGELALSDLVAETDSPVWGRSVRVASTSEALDNAKARKAGRPTPGQVLYKPGTGPVTPSTTPPAPKPTTPAPKPVTPLTAPDSVPGVGTPTRRPWDEPVPKFATVQEAETWVRDRWGDTYMNGPRDIRFGSIRLDAAQTFTEHLDDLLKRYPMVGDNILRVGGDKTFGDPANGALAFARRRNGSLIWSESWASAPDWSTRLDAAHAKGQFTAPGGGGVIDHEFGHHVHYFIERWSVGLPQPSRWMDNVEHLRKGLAPILKSVLGLKGSVGIGGPTTKMAVMPALSKYGTTNWYEFVAESWSECMAAERAGTSPRPLAGAVGDWLRTELAARGPQFN